MSDGILKIRKAAQNNLAGVDVDLPRNRLVAITGVSGSGKSSLAFDTLFREGQRRFLETLSAYARQFLGHMQKPDVESIEGLSPAIAVDQKALSRGARSTVGTLTEVVDHLRVLFARAGRAHCPGCGVPIESQTPESVMQQILGELQGKAVHVLAPLVRDRKGEHRALLAELMKKGFVRVRVDGEVQRIEEVGVLARYHRHTIELVVDRLRVDADQKSRLRDAVEQAIDHGEGDLIVIWSNGERAFSTLRSCPDCGADTPPLEPRLFSFNSPHGACPACEGLGRRQRPSAGSVVRDPALSIREGALAVTRASGGALLFPRVDFRFLEQVAAARGFDLDTPWNKLPAKARRAVLEGTGRDRFEDHSSWSGAKFRGSVRWMRRFRGVLPALERTLRQGSRRKMVQRFLSDADCPDCEGSRLCPAADAVRLGEVSLRELTSTPIEKLAGRLAKLGLTARERRIARDLLSEIRRRTEFLVEVGLGYLTLGRSADSLSGGEAQRIRLAAQLGAGLQGVLYVLDEPSIGLHARDHERLLGALMRLRDLGNTVVVVEHDEATLRAADYLIDVGPGAGRHGGRIVASGSPEEVARADSPTGRLLRGELALERPSERRSGDGRRLAVLGARAYNLKDVDVSFPLGTFTALTGVSGSGKSSLLEGILQRAVTRHLGREAAEPAEHGSIEGLEAIDELVAIDATPIGRTPRSNPATYTGVFGSIRDLFASLPEAQMRGYTKSRFSFNVAGGRCETCSGAGARYVELQFLAPVTVACEECGGHRFQAETLDVHYRGRSIADVLELTAEDALELFRDHPKIARPLSIMVSIGLGYLTLGQPSTTISGGEAQRLKLVTHLQKRPKKHTLYLLDEPTTGLHQEDVGRLVSALQSLVDLGHTVIVIEHNLELIQAADHVLDLGPEGGERGGELVVAGTPEQVAAHSDSHTGEALRSLLRARRKPPVKKSELRSVEPPVRLEVYGARTHNLDGIDVSIPRDALTVITGPSGSGKSSLALDTIHTEGRRRFVESLSTYARQFLGSRDKPPVDRIEGLGPSVAVEARTVSGHPRSTVATTTEIHDHLRVLWARAGMRRCPEHGERLEHGDPGQVARRVIKELEGDKGWVVAPIFGNGSFFGGGSSASGPSEKEPPGDAVDPARALADCLGGWRAAGFVRALLDGEELRLEELEACIKRRKEPVLDLVIDRLSFDAKSRARLADAVEQAEAISGGRISVIARSGRRIEFSTKGACPRCGFGLSDELEPRHFSFNTHVGACPDCDGLGERMHCAAELLIARPAEALCDGAIPGKLGRYLAKGKGYYEHLLRHVARVHRIDIERPFERLNESQRKLLAYGVGARKRYEVNLERHTRHVDVEESFVASWPGLCGQVDAWHQKTDDPEWATILETVMSRRVCSLCTGERLRPESRAVTVGRKRLPQVLSASVDEALDWLNKLRLPAASQAAVEPVVLELSARLELLVKVGLGYLTLDRATSTLSGGEARRVRLSASLGSKLVGVCYVLDEPTVGLHPADIARLTDTLEELRERGNTVIVVEHDQSLMERADWIVDMGPGAGSAGGRVVASGPPAEIAAHPESLTGQALRGELRLERSPRGNGTSAARDSIALLGARTHNLKGVDLEFEFGRITGLCGPSGSGKSSLVMGSLVPALRGETPQGRWRRLVGAAGGGVRVVVIDANPIGRTPASLPATYCGLMDPLRALFARTPDARMRGFSASHFSFNSTKGRCLACDGRGAERIEMQFLADLWLECEECDGRRYRPEVLEVKLRGKSIADVLALSVDEALEFLQHQPDMARILQTLSDVGLGYLHLGQSSTSLSGGEAQRLKLASELFRAEGGVRCVLILDEPTTGLHASDLVHLARVLERLAQRGNAVVVIEHHTELLGMCDQLVELGPGGGEAGGWRIASGTPQELSADPASVTGPWLLCSGALATAEDGVRKVDPGKGGARRRGAAKAATKAVAKGNGRARKKKAKRSTGTKRQVKA